jgi:hypothetical protein
MREHRFTGPAALSCISQRFKSRRRRHPEPEAKGLTSSPHLTCNLVAAPEYSPRIRRCVTDGRPEEPQGAQRRSRFLTGFPGHTPGAPTHGLRPYEPCFASLRSRARCEDSWRKATVPGRSASVTRKRKPQSGAAPDYTSHRPERSEGPPPGPRRHRKCPAALNRPRGFGVTEMGNGRDVFNGPDRYL